MLRMMIFRCYRSTSVVSVGKSIGDWFTRDVGGDLGAAGEEVPEGRDVTMLLRH